MDIQAFSVVADWQAASLKYVVEKIEDTLKQKKICRIALSGGSTPKWLYSHLGQCNLQWKRIEIFQVDERYVPLGSQDLNAGMLRATCVRDQKAFADVHFFNVSVSWKQAAAEYTNLLETLTSPLFDLVILGVGPDGHTASLFPGSAALHSEQLVATTTTDVFAGRKRLTLTPKALNQSDVILILASGLEKKQIIERLKWGKDSMDVLPIMCVREHRKVSVMLLSK